MSTNCNNQNPDHAKQLSRINRILGQLEGVKKMILENRYCPDIIVQLSAIRSAVHAVETNILQDHLHACVENFFNGDLNDDSKQDKIDEISELFKRFKS